MGREGEYYVTKEKMKARNRSQGDEARESTYEGGKLRRACRRGE